MANRHKKRPSTLLIIRKMKIKTSIGYCSTPVRMVIIKNHKKPNVGQEKREPSYIVGGNVNWCSHYRKQHRGSPPKISDFTPGYVSEDNRNPTLKRCMYASQYSQQRCLQNPGYESNLHVQEPMNG